MEALLHLLEGLESCRFDTSTWLCQFSIVTKLDIVTTRKYPLRGYILGVLTHTTALDRLWGGDETLTMWTMSIRTSASPRQQRSHWSLRVTQDVYFSLLTHTKQLLLVTFCYTSAGIQASFRTHGRTDGGRKDRQTWKSK